MDDKLLAYVTREASSAAVDDLLLAKMNESASLSKQLAEIIERAVEAQAIIMLCQLLRRARRSRADASSAAPRPSQLPEAFQAALISLTAREREIAQLVGQGLRNRQIADTLGISKQTVKNILHGAFEKLGVRDRVELTLYVRQAEMAALGGGED